MTTHNKMDGAQLSQTFDELRRLLATEMASPHNRRPEDQQFGAVSLIDLLLLENVLLDLKRIADAQESLAMTAENYLILKQNQQ